MAELQIAVTKGKGTVAIDPDKLSDEVFKEVLLQGLKVLVNRGMSKITKETYPKEDEMKAAAMAKAAEQVEAILKGDIRFTSGTKAKKASGAIMQEARRLAKQMVKQAMKEEGIKVSHVESSEITRAANELLEDEETGKALIAQATENLKERDEATAKLAKVSSIAKAIKVSPKKVAAAEKKAAEDKEKRQLSAKQAGKVAPRAKKGKGQQAPAPAQA